MGRSVTFALERTRRQAAEQSQALLADQLQLVLEASAEGICLSTPVAVTFANSRRRPARPPRRSSWAALHDFH